MQVRSLGAQLVLNLGLGLAFLAAARLGLAFANGPAQTTAVWPASGVALGALMVWGWRIFPGLLLGSLVHEGMWISNWASPVQWLATVLLTGAGALQWALLHALMLDWWQRMQASAIRWSLRFAVLVLLGCVMASSLGNAALLGLGRLAAGDFAQAWLTWWIGDCAGILVVTPLVLMVLHRGVRAHCVANQVFPVLTMGLGLSLSGSFLLGHLERESALSGKRADLRMLAQSLQTQMALAEAGVARLADLHYRVALNEEDFDAAGRELRRELSWVTGFAYLGRVRHADRAPFEQRLGFNFSSLRPDGSLEKAPEQSSYWVTLRLSPTGGQEARLGLDEGSEPVRRAALEKAVSSRRPALSAVLTNLHFAANEALAVQLVAPTYEANQLVRRDTATATGAVVASIPLRPLFDQALSQFPNWQDDVLLLSDDPEPAGVQTQGQDSADLGRSAAQTVLAQWLKSPHLQESVRFGDRSWQLRAAPAELGLRPGALQGMSLLVGLAFTGLLSAFLMARSRRDLALSRWREELEHEVGARTQALEEVNTHLRDEVVERQRMADQLRQSGELLMRQTAQLHTLLKHMPDLAWLKDLEGRYTLVNPALERFLGHRGDELLGHVAEDFLDPNATQHALELDASAALVNTPLESEVELRDAQGRLRVHAVTRVAIRDAQGQRIGLLGVARDVTARREREATLQRFRWLADSAAQGFAFSDLNGHLVYLNQTARKWMGDPDWQEGSARQARDYLDAPTRERLRTEIWPLVQAQGSWSGLLPLRGLPGAQPPDVHTSLFVMRDEQGEARNVAMVMTDLSERLRLERDLDEARLKAESANRAKSDFLANMSHEIRTPLNAVLGYAQLLREDQELPGGAKARVDSIYNAGARLLRLINDVLDLAKIEAGALQLNVERIDLGREIEESVRLLHERARSAGLALDLQLELPRPLHVLMDRGKLGQVLLNLLGNALKFTAQGGVQVHASLDDPGQLDLRIQDSGAGMDEAELAQLFSPFVQGQAGHLRGGTGLGLSLSRSLVRAMGGELSLSSQPGQGTCARIVLPLQRCEGTDHAQPDAAHDTVGSAAQRLVPGSHCSVLVVEDDPDSRQLLVALLHQVGCTVLEAEHGAQALECLARAPVDLILTDMRMPVMDGVALRRHVSNHPQWARIPMVAVTASSLLHEREAFLDMGFSDFIAKPFGFSQILLMLRTHAGAQLQAVGAAQPEPAAETVPATPSEPLAAAAHAAWTEALTWAQAGRAVELRQWVEQLPEAEAGARAALLTALGRYDLQTVETLLQARLGTLPTPGTRDDQSEAADR